jgi:dipeptidyl aminopeptidase/acylaminoacyl peptidase
MTRRFSKVEQDQPQGYYRRLFLALLRLTSGIGICSVVLVVSACGLGRWIETPALAYIDLNMNTQLQNLILLDFSHQLRVREPLQVAIGDLTWTRQRLIVTSYGGRSQWQVIDSSTGVSTIETRPQSEYLWRWSSDERYLAYAGTDPESGLSQLYIEDTDTGEIDALLESTSTTYSQPLLWSPDNRSLIYLQQTLTGLGSLHTYVPETREHTLIIVEGGEPAWSPDSTQIIYTAYIGQTDNPRLEVYDVQTGERRRLLPDDEQDQRTAAWSPDGEWVALAYDDAIAVARRDGSNLHVLTTPFFVSNPLWSPDSRSLIFIAGAGITSLYKIEDVAAAVEYVRETGLTLDPGLLTLDRQIYGTFPVWRP